MQDERLNYNLYDWRDEPDNGVITHLPVQSSEGFDFYSNPLNNIIDSNKLDLTNNFDNDIADNTFYGSNVPTESEPIQVIKIIHQEVEKRVPFIVEKHVPVYVEKPYKIEIEKHIPVTIRKPFPIFIPVYRHIYQRVSRRKKQFY